MHPELFHVGPLTVGSYAVCAFLAFAVALRVRSREMARLQLVKMPGHQWVGVGALLGAMVGAKVGMLLFLTPEQMEHVVQHMLDLDFSGKTVVGALAGGYAGVEVAKKLVGITVSTGDTFAVAVPLGQAIGRVGCFLNGCCYGTPSTAPWAVSMAGALREPVQLYESALDLLLAAVLWSLRHQGYPSGHLFRRYLVGYGAIRFTMEFWRGDPELRLGPLTLIQWVCLAVVVGFSILIARGEHWFSRATPAP